MSRLDFLYRKFAHDIERYGRSVLAIGGSEDGSLPPFSYTIGNWQKHQLPELLVIGYNDNQLLNILSAKMIERGRKFDDGELVSLGGKFPIKIITTSGFKVKSDYTIQTGQFYRHENYLVQQVLVPDRKGVFPDQPGCATKYLVPILRAH
jgi:hypothetical protein